MKITYSELQLKVASCLEIVPFLKSGIEDIIPNYSICNCGEDIFFLGHNNNDNNISLLVSFFNPLTKDDFQYNQYIVFLLLQERLELKLRKILGKPLFTNNKNIFYNIFKKTRYNLKYYNNRIKAILDEQYDLSACIKSSLIDINCGINNRYYISNYWNFSEYSIYNTLSVLDMVYLLLTDYLELVDSCCIEILRDSYCNHLGISSYDIKSNDDFINKLLVHDKFDIIIDDSDFVHYFIENIESININNLDESKLIILNNFTNDFINEFIEDAPSFIYSANLLDIKLRLLYTSYCELYQFDSIFNCFSSEIAYYYLKNFNKNSKLYNEAMEYHSNIIYALDKCFDIFYNPVYISGDDVYNGFSDDTLKVFYIIFTTCSGSDWNFNDEIICRYLPYAMEISEYLIIYLDKIFDFLPDKLKVGYCNEVN